MVYNLLSDVVVGTLEQGFTIDLNWLAHLIKLLIEGIGITGVGIIVFTLILKAVVLPFDIYQRVKMRKQTLIMKKMQPDLEKLQKQYANDQNMYSQKMMELYKKNGYSMLGACLPMIVSLVVLIFAFQALNSYSQYANLSLYEGMANSYNTEIVQNVERGDDYKYVITDEGAYICIIETAEDGNTTETAKKNWVKNDSWVDNEISYTMEENGDGSVRYLKVQSTDETKYIYYTVELNTDNKVTTYKIDHARLSAIITSDENAAATMNAIKAQYVDKDGNPTVSDVNEYDRIYVEKLAGLASAEYFRSQNPGWLWIKNIWYPDVSYAHPIQAYDEFTQTFANTKVVRANGSQGTVGSVITKEFYNKITSELTSEKSVANGYYILITLSIGFMVLSQFVSMKSSKEANQYQTVDGKGVNQQKMMMIMMPLIYAIFAFRYSAAFSIYMLMSSIMAILTTLLCNLVINKRFDKKEEEDFVKKHTRTAPTAAKKDNK